MRIDLSWTSTSARFRRRSATRNITWSTGARAVGARQRSLPQAALMAGSDVLWDALRARPRAGEGSRRPLAAISLDLSRQRCPSAASEEPAYSPSARAAGRMGNGGRMGRIGKYLQRNAIALLALFLALGGTTYAASSALGPRTSVASPQVVNGSLKTLDLSKAHEGVAWPRGARGRRRRCRSKGAHRRVGRDRRAGVAGTSGCDRLAATCDADASVASGASDVSARATVLDALRDPTSRELFPVVVACDAGGRCEPDRRDRSVSGEAP